MKLIDLVNAAISQGINVEYYKRKDGGIRVSRIDSLFYSKSLSEGNKALRALFTSGQAKMPKVEGKRVAKSKARLSSRRRAQLKKALARAKALAKKAPKPKGKKPRKKREGIRATEEEKSAIKSAMRDFIKWRKKTMTKGEHKERHWVDLNYSQVYGVFRKHGIERALGTIINAKSKLINGVPISLLDAWIYHLRVEVLTHEFVVKAPQATSLILATINILEQGKSFGFITENVDVTSRGAIYAPARLIFDMENQGYFSAAELTAAAQYMYNWILEDWNKTKAQG